MVYLHEGKADVYKRQHQDSSRTCCDIIWMHTKKTLTHGASCNQSTNYNKNQMAKKKDEKDVLADYSIRPARMLEPSAGVGVFVDSALGL